MHMPRSDDELTEKSSRVFASIVHVLANLTKYGTVHRETMHRHEGGVGRISRSVDAYMDDIATSLTTSTILSSMCMRSQGADTP